MKVFAGGLALLLVLAAGDPAAAQQAGDRLEPVRAQLEDVAGQVESIAKAAAPELERTFAQLSGTLAALAARIAGDPQLRASALRAAQGMADVAHIVVVEQSAVLQDALREAAEKMAEWSARQGNAPAPR